MNRIILLIGVQGSGKTWVFQQLINQYRCQQKKKLGTIKYHTNGWLVVVGKYDKSMFQGSDKLSMSVMSDYLAFNQFNQDKVILLEGDRFTNSKVINNDGYKPLVIKITDDGSKGRELRGSNQSEMVIKRMQTRVNNINADVEVENSDKALEYIVGILNQQEATLSQI